MAVVAEIPPLPQVHQGNPRQGWPWRREARAWPKLAPNGRPWPRLSVVTPSYNQAAFLEETIRSVLLQGYPNLEYLVIDGGSSDGSAEIIQRYEPWLTYWVSERDRGQAHAINKGLERATGTIAGWVNSDDMYVDGAFRKIVEGFIEHPEIALAHGNRIMIDEESRVCGWSVLPRFDPERSGFNVCSETAFWRVAEGESLFLKEDLRFAMDLEFFSRIYREGNFLKLNAFLGYFRCHDASKSSQIPEIGRFEAEREWKTIFGASHEGWRLQQPGPPAQQMMQFFLHPTLLTYPYLYRRFICGRRGF